MQIKRYFADDMRQAIRKVREAQGPDAVILSNRKVDSGVEIVAAVDYDESAFADVHFAAEGWREASRTARQVLDTAEETARKSEPEARPAAPPQRRPEPALNAMRDELITLRGLLEQQLSGLAWGELGRRSPQRAALLRRLLELDLSVDLVRHVVSQIPDSPDPDVAWRLALGQLAHRIKVADDGILTNGGVIALIGPTGVGKTTTVAKLAARFALRHGADQVALLTTDSYRVGAVEQLRTYGRIMGVRVRVTKDREELRAAVEDLWDRRLVLIDTAGMSQRDIRLSEQLALLRDGSQLVQNYLVLAATSQGMALEETVRAFRGSHLDGCIVTKLDEATSLGNVLSVVVQAQLRVAYVSDGQQVPEDLRVARATDLVTRAVSMMRRNRRPCEVELLEREYGDLAAHGAF
jgi:flagellar biosynthesis protein FlhF